MADEKLFENKVKKYLTERGCWHVKFFANKFTRVGVPDILACVNGYFLGIEVKASGGHPSDLQIWNRDKIRESGGQCIVLYPEQFNEFKAFIDSFFDGKPTNQYDFDR